MVAKRMDEAVRRLVRAGRMLLAGKTPAEAAHAVGVARQTAYTRNAMLDEGRIDALRAMPVPGRPARLDERNCRPWTARCCKVLRRTASAPNCGRPSA